MVMITGFPGTMILSLKSFVMFLNLVTIPLCDNQALEMIVVRRLTDITAMLSWIELVQLCVTPYERLSDILRQNE